MVNPVQRTLPCLWAAALALAACELSYREPSTPDASLDAGFSLPDDAGPSLQVPDAASAAAADAADEADADSDAAVVPGADAASPAADDAGPGSWLDAAAAAGDSDAASPAGPDAGAPGDAATAGLDATASPPDAGAWVQFVAPVDQATVPNPVVFEIAASPGVEEVQIFADETWPLAPAWDPALRDTLRYRFVGTGVPRSLKLVGRAGGQDIAEARLTITVLPDSCEDRFFVTWFDQRNVDPTGQVDVAALREDALAAIKAQVAGLQACGAGVTLGGMMSLLLYEGGLRIAAFNTRCNENSYNNTSHDCDLVAEALYSYQYGIGAIHTSNFHPCKGGSYTQGMRQRFLAAASAAGFDTSANLMTPALTTRFHTVCPAASPTAIDYYILAAHSVFGVPRNTAGNHLAAYGQFPFFTPSVSIDLVFHGLGAACASIQDDRDAIAAFGGGDSSYQSPAKQDQILAYYLDFAATSCP